MSFSRTLLLSGGLLGVLATVALAAEVSHTTTADFDQGTPSLVNLTTTGDQLALDNLTSEAPSGTYGWSFLLGGSEPLLEIEKNAGSPFDHADSCLPIADSPLSDAAHITVNGRSYRGGPDNDGTYETSINSGSLVLDLDSTLAADGAGRIAGLQEVRFLTGPVQNGAGPDNRTVDYTVTFDYDGSTEVVTVPIHKAVHSPRNDYSGTNYDVYMTTVGDSAPACGVVDEVIVTNPNPTEPATVTITWDTTGGGGDNWLLGPLALSLLIDQTTWDGLFSWYGSYESDAIDVGANALWHELTVDHSLNDGQIEVSFACSTDGTTFDFAPWGSPIAVTQDTSETFPLIDATSSSPTQACAGRYAKYRVELYGGGDPTGPVVDAVTLGWEPDVDNDGYPASGDFVAPSMIDCDDGDPAVNPETTWYLDDDGDGYGDPSQTQQACAQPTGYVANPDDCDDGDADVNPETVWFHDGDGDTYGDPGDTLQSCTQPPGYLADDSDCDDGDDTLNPDTPWYLDGDDDGYGDPADVVHQCEAPNNRVRNDLDCDDGDGTLNPDTPWYLDDDGDGYGDDGSVLTQCEQPTGHVRTGGDCDDGDNGLNPDTVWYADDDGDTYGDPNATQQACEQPSGHVDNALDCDDTDSAVNPDTRWYEDSDSDGFGNPGAYTAQCEPVAGHVPDSTDCDDGDNSVHPGATETPADGVDQDCDGADACYQDGDGDGIGTATVIDGADLTCANAGESDRSDDCDDGNGNVYPGATPVCGNGTDDDCSGLGHFGPNAGEPGGYLDDDGDGLDHGTEQGLGTDDCDADSDNDGLDDNLEIDHGTSPLNPDTDGDTLTDHEEVVRTGTDPLQGDSDGDGVPDPDEVGADLDNPLNTDGDDLIDAWDPDDDDDGVPTSVEDHNGNGDAFDDDADGDGTPDFRDADDDGDGLPTASEVYGGNTDPTAEDTDGDLVPDYLDDDDDDDGVPTAFEVDAGSDFLHEDSDGDGLDDLDEWLNGLHGAIDCSVAACDDLDPLTLDVLGTSGSAFDDPWDRDGDGVINALDLDDDGDGVPTADELPLGDLDLDGVDSALDPDDDGDGVPTWWERAFSTDPLLADSDGDQVPDGQEWTNWLLDNPDVRCDHGPWDFCEDLDPASDPGAPQPSTAAPTGTGFDDPWDRDGDGLINALDNDDDGDGIPTFEDGLVDGECLPVGNRDGIPNYLDFDTNGDGTPDAILGDGDENGNDTEDYKDCNYECGPDADLVDDGLQQCQIARIDALETACGALVDTGCDTCWQGYLASNDWDGDGIPNNLEVGDTSCFQSCDTSCTLADTDNDGVPDVLDDDDDGDGFPTADEIGLCPDGTPPSADAWYAFDQARYDATGGQEGWLPHCDPDVPHVLQQTDAATGGPFPLSPDSIPDYLDDDDDGDGKPSLDEGDGDLDADGLPNWLDPNDHDGPEADADGDGLTNAEEAALGTDPYRADSDGDGIPDGQETGAVDDPRDSDGDEIPDALDPDDDGDGIPTVDEGEVDTDGDGAPNHLDSDSDGDGTPDATEGTGDADCDGIPNYVDADDADGSCTPYDDGSVLIIEHEGCGGCATGGGPAPLSLLAFAGVLVGLRRRR